MTRREAQQRAAVYGAHIQSQYFENVQQHAAILNTWDKRTRLVRQVWREDIEDAVLDCGRLQA